MQPTIFPRHSSSIRTPSRSVPACGERRLSPLQWVWEKVFSIKADIDYSHLTWSMLDPLHGTSERVLDHSVSTDATADVETLHNEMAGAAPPIGVPHADCASTSSDDDPRWYDAPDCIL